MAISLASLRRGTVLTPPRILLFGVHGVGKTTLACQAPDPVLIQTEDGKGLLDTPSQLLTSYAEVIEWLNALGEQEHEFRTVILDSLDHLEPLVWAETCTRNGWTNIEEPGYGKGYLGTDAVWRELFTCTDALREFRSMSVIFIAHAEVKAFRGPLVEPFDRYLVKLHPRASALVQEHVDAVLFANWHVSITKDGATSQGKGGHTRGVGGGQRMIYTEERPAYIAKNRWSMPEQIRLPDNPSAAWTELARHIPYYNTQEQA